MMKAFLTLISCSFFATSYASSFDDYCPTSRLRFQNVLDVSGMESTIATAVQLLDNPDSSKEEKYAALPMLGCSKDDAYSVNLIAALDDSDRDIRGGAIIAMRYLRSEKTVNDHPNGATYVRLKGAT